MRKFIKKLLIMCVIVICFCNTAYAKEGIESIDIDVYVNEAGDAFVTEVWNCEAYSGTEWYHPYYNLANARITDLAVSENGREYEVLSYWSTSASRVYKEQKCGINYVSDGLELCWGMGSYGKHEYKVTYTIKNFVDKLNDSQMIYWTLLPHDMSDKVENATIKIHADKAFDAGVEVWGFGEEGGICRVNNGIIEMNSKDGKEKNEYMTILVKLPVDFFDSTNSTDKYFEDYYNEAIKGTKINKFKSITNFMEQNKNIILIIMTVIMFFIYMFLGYFLSVIGKGIEKISKKTTPLFGIVFWLSLIFLIQWMSVLGLFIWFIIGVIADKLIKEKKVISGKIRESQVEYYRDIPCEKDIFKTYYIAYQYGIIKKETDLLGAVILKWVKENRAIIIDKDDDNKNDCISLSTDYIGWEWGNQYERQLYQMMYEASGDGILEKKELKKWCNNKYSKLFTWFDGVMLHEQGKLVESGELLLEKKGKKVKYIATEAMLMQGKEICGLKKYLKDFSLIHEREAVEVHLFEDYLIIAQMLGIAKKVANQFKELYPNVIEDSIFDYNDYIFVHSISYRTIRTASCARTMSDMAKAASSGGGGGGRSFGGGGGGSRGGGGGGGGRR